MDAVRKKILVLFPELKPFSRAVLAENAGAYIVGGAIRDILLGTEPKDIDFVPSRRGQARMLAELFVTSVGGSLVEFQSHGDIFRVVYRGCDFDFTDLQADDIQADLRRRDFTINSMALCLEETADCNMGIELIDPMSGRADIEKRIVRVNHPSVYDDDPLRILRLFRFAFRLDFRMDSYSYRLIPQKLFGLERVSHERIRDELMALFAQRETSRALEAMEGVGVLTWIFPALKAAMGFAQNDFHHLDVYSHTLEGIAQLDSPSLLQHQAVKPYADRVIDHLMMQFPTGHSRIALLKLAMLLHDIGKPETATIEPEGRIRFIGHEKAGADVAREYLNELKFSKREISYILSIIEGHMRPGQINLGSPTMHKQLYRFYKTFGDSGPDMAVFSLADRLAAKGIAVTDELIEREYEICAELLDAYFNRAKIIVRPPKLISGRVLIDELGVAPGPRVGVLLDRIEEAQVDGKVTDAKSAIAYAKELIDRFDQEKTTGN